MEGNSMYFFLILGAILFMIFEHPLIFWIIVIPLAIISIISFIAWLK